MTDLSGALAAYNLHRAALPSEPLCHAPFVNLHFSHGGTALACCHNRTYALGTYPDDSVAEIWSGDKADRLRHAVGANDLSKGCQPCARQLLARDLVGLSDMAGSYADAISKASWKQIRENGLGLADFARAPRRLEFEIHNSCNLECVMCHGAASSSIRKYRDALPPLPTPYDEAFVDQLSPFLSGVHEAGFTGGEPFLIPLYYKIWERIAHCNREMVLVLVTNGTILDDRVRSLVEELNFVINVSVDSIVEETFESIRKGASLKRVMDASRYFAGVMEKKGLPFIWRCCVMRQNWREMPQLVRFCDDHGIRVVFNQVEFPLNFSLHTLSPVELREIVGHLRAEDTFDGTNAVHRFNHEQYRGLLNRLEGFVDPATWQRALVDRVENSSANPMLHRWSTRAMQLDADPAADDLAEAISKYVASKLTLEQARRNVGRKVVPSAAWRTHSDLDAQVRGFRAEVSTEAFLRIFLNVALRTYVKIIGVPADHGAHVFDRIDPAVAAVVQRRDGDEVVDDIVACPPDALYDQIVRQERFDVTALRKHSAE